MRKFFSPLRRKPRENLSNVSGAQPTLPETQNVNLLMSNTKLVAARDNIIYSVAGNVKLAQDSRSLLQRLQNVLHPIDAAFDSYEAEERSNCFENTRVQLLEDIQKWMNGSNGHAPIFFLDGVAGIGKTTVAQTIAEQASKVEILGASFFFSRNQEQRTTAKYFFATVAFQLARFIPAYALELDKVLSQDPKAAQKTISQQMKLLILEPLQNSLSQDKNSILIIVDALDECKDEEAVTLLTLLAQHIRAMSNVKLFITARPEWHIRKILDSDRNHELFRLHEIDERIVQSDIRLYLEYTLSVAQVQKSFPHRQPTWQPTVQEMDMLCGVCGTLFIIASTATKFILDIKGLGPGKRLTSLLDGVSPSDFSGSKRTDVMDTFYLQIILSALPSDPEEVDEWFDRYQTVLGTIIALQNPLPSHQLAELLSIEHADIEEALLLLHSLVAPSGSEITFRVHHKTFPDFITNEDRILRALMRLRGNEQHLVTRILINLSNQHYRVSTSCFRVMNGYLKTNIAGLVQHEWYLDKSSIPRVQRLTVPQACVYSVMHWATHLLWTDLKNGSIIDDLESWAAKQITAWLEIMSILDQTDVMHDILKKAEDAINTQFREVRPLYTTRQLISDAIRFVLQNKEVIRVSPMHVHWSALPFAPHESCIVKSYRDQGEHAVTIPCGLPKVWDPTLLTIAAHSDWVNAIALSPDAMILASASNDATIKLWDARTGNHINTLTGHTHHVQCVVFSPDGYILASASNDKICILWDAKTAAPLMRLEGHDKAVAALVFSSDGSKLASGSLDHTVRLWDRHSGKNIAILRGHPNPVSFVIFAPDDQKLASACGNTPKNGSICLWDANTGCRLSSLEGHTRSIRSLIFSNDGTRVVTSSVDLTVRVWCSNTGKEIMTLQGHSDEINEVVYSSDGMILASASDDKTVRLWDGTTGALIATLEGHTYGVSTIRFSPNNTRLATASNDRTIRLWDTQTKQHIGTFYGHSDVINTLVFLPDGLTLVSASDDQSIRLWDVESANNEVDPTMLSKHSDTVTSVAFSLDGHKMASGAKDDTIRIWDCKNGALLSTIVGHTSWVTSVVFSLDSLLLASGSEDGVVKVWDALTNSSVATLQPEGPPASLIESIVFSMDGNILASVSEYNEVKVWDLKTQTILATFQGYHEAITGLVILPNNLHVMVGSKDPEQLLATWDIKTGDRIHTVPECTGVQFVAISPYGQAGIAAQNQLIFQSGHKLISPPPMASLAGLFDTIYSIEIFFPSPHFPPSAPHTAQDQIQAKQPSIRLRAILFGLSRVKNLSGLAYVEVFPDGRSVAIPFCWFPPHINAQAIALHINGKRVGVGCADGRVLFLELPLSFSA